MLPLLLGAGHALPSEGPTALLLQRPEGAAESYAVTPTCGTCGTAHGGSPNCCGPGGSWAGLCDGPDARHTFQDGWAACNLGHKLREHAGPKTTPSEADLCPGHPHILRSSATCKSKTEQDERKSKKAEKDHSGEDSEWGNLPRIVPHPKPPDNFCVTTHFMRDPCHKCNDWPLVQQRAQQLANASGFKSAPMLYLHAQKTGGSTLECATEGNPTLAPRWVNMGHTSREKVDNCIERCTFGEGEIVPKVVVMVRDPYSFCAPRVIPQATPWA